MQLASGVPIKSGMPATISEGYLLTSDADPTRVRVNDTSRVGSASVHHGITAYFKDR